MGFHTLQTVIAKNNKLSTGCGKKTSFSENAKNLICELEIINFFFYNISTDTTREHISDISLNNNLTGPPTPTVHLLKLTSVWGSMHVIHYLFKKDDVLLKY